MELKQIRAIFDQLADHEKRIHAIETGTQLTKRKMIPVQTDGENPDNLILSMANKVGSCDENEKIQSKVLDKTGMEGKILLCFFISYKYFKNAWLITSDIEKITSALGTKITAGNVSNKIKDELLRYLESGAVRKQGQRTPYRLNRKGVKRFEDIIHATEK